MKTPQENCKEIERLMGCIKSHPMCLRFSENESKYFFTYPNGDFKVDAVQGSKAYGKIKVLGKILNRMERDWVQSFPGAAQ